MRNKQRIINFLQSRKQCIICKIILKYYEVLTYLIFGVLTTLVNMIVYSIFEKMIGQSNWYFSNLPAIILAILFAYVTNRSFVFDSNGSFWYELYKFLLARIFVSFVFEYGSVFRGSPLPVSYADPVACMIHNSDFQ